MPIHEPLIPVQRPGISRSAMMASIGHHIAHGLLNPVHLQNFLI